MSVFASGKPRLGWSAMRFEPKCLCPDPKYVTLLPGPQGLRKWPKVSTNNDVSLLNLFSDLQAFKAQARIGKRMWEGVGEGLI